MSDAPAIFFRDAPSGVISTISEECDVRDAIMLTDSTTNAGINNTGNWPTNNRCFYYPFQISRPVFTQQMFWVNAVNLTGNIDVGIMDVAGVKIVSLGSTVRTPASGIQLGNIADTTLNPGSYFLAIILASTTGTVFCSKAIPAEMLRAYGCQQEDLGSTAIPSTATFSNISSLWIPWFGLVLASTA